MLEIISTQKKRIESFAPIIKRYVLEGVKTNLYKSWYVIRLQIMFTKCTIEELRFNVQCKKRWLAFISLILPVNPTVVREYVLFTTQH